MAKKSSIKRNLAIKIHIEKSKKRRLALSKVAKDISLPFEYRLDAQVKLSEMSRNGSPVRHRNRCSLTGRPRGYYGKFSLSRIALRELASWGQIPGLIKSSW